ncbi:cyclopropane-fatty-acyl-phospholipid synthase family protein [Pseudoalteromonas sp. OOF1S-7]|uniref:SAM-dependent methyltransferase n=1 Tax=Pseudoalteromonas sp. OOF1S-7 TaxID=2917757 RepID=UPI001EF3F6F3|nr:cyclopropane-fatty-acyl-phospholipid synthase family protein [Pseudoalteromonas sp. OOF1S-7]MCG7534952.1 cyclopropane-fatty-acyl-phospholipid synthase family protein [Pseudoalteromonas sp. OOF1S-7]
MEQNSQTISKPATSTWWHQLMINKARTFIFKLLKNLKHDRLEIIEGSEKVSLGTLQPRLQATIFVSDPGFYFDVLKGGGIGAAEAFIAGKWHTPDLTKVIRIFACAQSQLDELEGKMSWFTALKNRVFHLGNRNSESGSKQNILAHYDLSNDLYQAFLDPTMMYSSAVFETLDQPLEQAQHNKLKIICDKLELSADDHLLEIGTGWGALALFAAQNYGCKVTTTTISDAQHDFTAQRIEAAGLQGQITLLKQDYRLLEGKFDKLVSIEMIEAVGHSYMPGFFAKCSSLLKDDGLMLLQAITISDSRYDHYRNNVDFIQRYIFPGGCLPSVAVMSQHLATQTDMVVRDIDDIGLHYAQTLKRWRVQFEQNWQQIRTFGFDEQFRRLWLFYLQYCEGAFLERVISTHHLVARKPRYVGVNDEQFLAS